MHHKSVLPLHSPGVSKVKHIILSLAMSNKIKTELYSKEHFQLLLPYRWGTEKHTDIFLFVLQEFFEFRIPMHQPLLSLQHLWCSQESNKSFQLLHPYYQKTELSVYSLKFRLMHLFSIFLQFVSWILKNTTPVSVELSAFISDFSLNRVSDYPAYVLP